LPENFSQLFTHEFWHLPLHHCVRSHIIAVTFKDDALQFPGLSRTKPIFQDFTQVSRAWTFYTQKSRTFQEAWEPCMPVWPWVKSQLLMGERDGLMGHARRRHYIAADNLTSSNDGSVGWRTGILWSIRIS